MKNIYRTIIKTILNEGIHIWTEKDGIGFQNGEEGTFGKDGLGTPVIQIQRAKGGLRISKEENNMAELVDSYNGSIDELYTLAHEYGHHLSKKEGNWTEDYERGRDLINKDRIDLMSPEQKTAVFNEEKSAWDFAIRILTDSGWPNQDSVAAKAEHSLKTYREKLMIDSMQR